VFHQVELEFGGHDRAQTHVGKRLQRAAQDIAGIVRVERAVEVVHFHQHLRCRHADPGYRSHAALDRKGLTSGSPSRPPSGMDAKVWPRLSSTTVAAQRFMPFPNSLWKSCRSARLPRRMPFMSGDSVSR
jgi:hypothetical protein